MPVETIIARLPFRLVSLTLALHVGQATALLVRSDIPRKIPASRFDMGLHVNHEKDHRPDRYDKRPVHRANPRQILPASQFLPS